VVGLTIDAERLADIRRERARLMQANRQRYAGLVEVYEELAEATDIHRRLGCPVIDVTELSVEETAVRIVRLVERRTHELHANPS
jgi:regulator of PEP synthase PpsR (kinase-PPPase family)